MQIQEAIIESPEAQQAPEIPSPSADDRRSREARGRYGCVALLAVAAIAVGRLVVQVIASPEPSFELDPSYAEAEQNRFGALAGDSVSAEPVTRPTPRSALNGEVWAELATTSTPISAIGGEVWSESTR